MKMRKATFYVQSINGLNTYTPVNDRAWKFARALGTNTFNTDDLRTIKANGANPFVYKGKELRAVRV